MPAANALLKSLEEAPDYIRFILMTSWPSRLPVTILSRCIRVRVTPTTKQVTTNEKVTDIRKTLKAGALEHEDIETLGTAISNSLRASGPNNELRKLTMRLVDYYRIKGSNGNEKLAREVLLTHLPYN